VCVVQQAMAKQNTPHNSQETVSTSASPEQLRALELAVQREKQIQASELAKIQATQNMLQENQRNEMRKAELMAKVTTRRNLNVTIVIVAAVALLIALADRRCLKLFSLFGFSRRYTPCLKKTWCQTFCNNFIYC